jgi:hypothetical protein
MDQALYHTNEYDFLALQEVAVDKRIEKAYCPLRAKYTAIYSGRRATLYIHKKWNEKTLQTKAGNDWAKLSIGEGAFIINIWSIYSLIQIGGLWRTFLTSIQPGQKAVIIGDFNSHYPLWDVHGRSSRGSSELVAYMLR